MTAVNENFPDRKLPEEFVETFDNFCVGLVDLKYMRGQLAALLDKAPESRNRMITMIDFAFREGLIKASTFEVLTTDIDRVTSEDEATEWSEQTLEKMSDEYYGADIAPTDETNHPIEPEHSISADAPVTEEISSGTVLNNRFELGEKIGSGSMADVFAAIDRRKQEAGLANPGLAIKVISKAFSRHANSLETLQREALNGQNLTHPNIVRIFDCDRDDNRLFMTMELLEGESLAKLMDRRGFRPLPFNQALSILKGASRGLQYAHEQGVVHADIKPGNIFIGADDKPKLLDFGIARISRIDHEQSNSTVIGAHTPGFASCEVLEGAEPDEQDDLYALACVAYRMLAGRRPFGRSNAIEAERKQLEPEIIETLNHGQWEILKKALAFRRTHRTRSVAEFISEFFTTTTATVAAAATTEARHSPIPDSAPKVTSFAHRLSALMSLRNAVPAVSAVLVGALILLLRPEPEPAPLPVAVFNPPGMSAPSPVIERPEPLPGANTAIVTRNTGDPATPLKSADEPTPAAEESELQEQDAPPIGTRQADLLPLPESTPEPAEPSQAEQLALLADAALAEGRLLDPPNDNAVGYINELNELLPETNEVEQRKTRLIDLMLIETMVSISDQDFDSADRWITETRNMGASDESLQRFETELQKARDAESTRKKESLGAIFASATPAAILADSAIEYPQTVPAAPAQAKVEQDTNAAGSNELVGGSFALAMTPGALPMVATPAVEIPPPASNQDIALSELEFKRFVEPKVPRRTSTRKNSGWVELKFLVTSSGRTDDISVIDAAPDDRFESAAITAVSKWRFKPVYIDGVATEKYSTVRLRFEPQ